MNRWLFTVAAVLVATQVIGLLAWIAARAWRRRIRATDRTPEHLAMVRAVEDWVTDEAIARCMVQTGVATLEGLQRTLNEIWMMDEGETRATVALLLQHRDVRRLIAVRRADIYKCHHEHRSVAKARACSQSLAMIFLLKWAQPVREIQPA